MSSGSLFVHHIWVFWLEVVEDGTVSPCWVWRVRDCYETATGRLGQRLCAPTGVSLWEWVTRTYEPVRMCPPHGCLGFGEERLCLPFPAQDPNLLPDPVQPTLAARLTIRLLR